MHVPEDDDKDTEIARGARVRGNEITYFHGLQLEIAEHLFLTTPSAERGSVRKSHFLFPIRIIYLTYILLSFYSYFLKRCVISLLYLSLRFPLR